MVLKAFGRPAATATASVPSKIISAFALAIAVPRHDSHHAARFAELVKAVFPGRMEQILTDNDNGFQGAFAACAKAQGWHHRHVYPHSPKMNARSEVVGERFNRTVQEDFVEYCMGPLHMRQIGQVLSKHPAG